MAILVLEHHPLETAGRLGVTLNEHGHRQRIVQLHAGDPLPPDLDDVDGLISLGGPMNVDQTADHAWMQPEIELIRQAHEADLPVLGICLGAQLIASALGGEVAAMDEPEIGFYKLTSTFFGTTDPLHLGFPWDTMMFHAHAQQITKAPPGGTPIPLSGTARAKCQAFRVGLNTYGFQYHFEWTRRTIEMLVQEDQEFYGSGQHTTDALLRSLEAHYPLYRHLGDRLCQNLATLMFPLDKRLPPSGANVENYHAS